MVVSVVVVTTVVVTAGCVGVSGSAGEVVLSGVQVVVTTSSGAVVVVAFVVVDEVAVVFSVNIEKVRLQAESSAAMRQTSNTTLIKESVCFMNVAHSVFYLSINEKSVFVKQN